MLNTLSERVKGMDITVTFDDGAAEKIADAGFDPVYGARPLRRAIQTEIEDKLSEEMLEGKVKAGESYVCKADESGFVFENTSTASPSEEPKEE